MYFFAQKFNATMSLTTYFKIIPKSSTSTSYSLLQTRSVSSSPYGRTHVWKRRLNKLPNPVVPQFPQKVIRSDGSTFTHWTTSPRSVIRLTRDVTNNPLWNVSALTGEGAAEESATTGRLGRFNRRFVEVGASGEQEIDWMGEAEAPAAAAAPEKKKK
ncbi:hypothetical protein EW146_g6248 [Bondarzewia mesenterica]|uniref:Ribosomal protein bL31m N-terminal domain-containing protein n=1 Tax=Bondarzewia mesenterica TaxID=1095465 RepID=A0A4V3XEK8_9AGAM|nr:hypothetical protein EW146_g6248 [Bondarzewia mesenterica]